MALTKRGSYWHYEFIYKKKRFQGSTGQKNINQARLALAAIRSNAALEHLGVAPPRVSPLFRDYMEGRFLTHIRQHCRKPRTVEFYESRTLRLLDYFADFRLSDIDEDAISKYTIARATMKHRPRGKKAGSGRGRISPPLVSGDHSLSPSSTGTIARSDSIRLDNKGRALGISNGTVNRELATLVRALRLAYEWKLIARIPKIHRLPNEKGRDYVLTGEMENAYLAAITYPLLQAAILMIDCGLRPEECVSLRKADILDSALQVRDGKTANARRILPMTQRAIAAVALLCALFPDSEWLFPGRKPGTHMTRANLDHLHQAARLKHGWPQEFVIYCCRHTYGTRLAESGAQPFEICKLMGHHSITVSQRYIHLSAEHLTMAAKRAEAFSKMLRGEVHSESGSEQKVPH